MPKKKLTREEEIERGVEKVERMNKAFDKYVIPLVLFTVVTIFIFGAVPRLLKLLSADSADGTEQGVESTVADFYSLREDYMSNMHSHAQELEAAGYEFSDQYSGADCVYKYLDESTIVYEFYDDALGSYSIIRRAAQEEAYRQLSMVVSAKNLIRVELDLVDGQKISLTYIDESFSAYGSDLSESDAQLNAQIIEENVGKRELSLLLGEYKNDMYELLNAPREEISTGDI